MTSGHTHDESKNSSLTKGAWFLNLKWFNSWFQMSELTYSIQGLVPCIWGKKCAYFFRFEPNCQLIDNSFISYLISKFLKKPTMGNPQWKKILFLLYCNHVILSWQHSINDLFLISYKFMVLLSVGTPNGSFLWIILSTSHIFLAVYL